MKVSLRFLSTVTCLVLFACGVAFAAEEMLQNDNGVCDQSIGCSSPLGDSGNPNDIVECFDSATLTAPFNLTTFTYIVSDDTPPPNALSLKVYEWAGAGPPGALIAAVALGAADTSAGPHTVAVVPPVAISTQDFCVGLNGEALDDGFRLAKSTTVSVAGTSWILAPTCGAAVFTTTTDIGFPGNWCITATIGSAEGACCDDGPGTDSECIIATEDDCVSAGGTFLGVGSECYANIDCTALAVTMDSMSATQMPNGVQLSWTTAIEIDTVGFRILRASSARSKSLRVIGPMIPAVGNGVGGATYEYLDSSVGANSSAVYYFEDIDVYGKVTRHGPVKVEGPRTRPTFSRER